MKSTAMPQSMIYSPSPQPPDILDLNNSSASPPSFNNRIQEENVITDSMFKYMPMLKRVTPKNMIPIYDYEQYPL